MSYSYHPEQDCFDAEVNSINYWGTTLLPPIYFALMLISLVVCVLSTQYAETIAHLVPWVVGTGIALAISIHGGSQFFLMRKIRRLFEFPLLSELNEEDDEVQMWLEREHSAWRGAVHYGGIGSAIFLGGLVELIAKAMELPPLWFGALPASLVIFLFARWFFLSEWKAAPRQRKIACRLAEKAVREKN